MHSTEININTGILDKITAIFMQSDEFNANQCVDDMFECFLAFTKKHITSVLAI